MTNMLPVFDIQKYSLHDGDGIRTTIFFKGCPLRCAWCHNPESWSATPEILWNSEKCNSCGFCSQLCPNKGITMVNGRPVTDKAICNGCGKCVIGCLNGARELSGKGRSVTELVQEAEKDQIFYERSGGGVTLSGGEVMATEPFDSLITLARRIHEKGLSLFVDTSGCVPFARYEAILPYTDAFLYDIKAMNPEKHRRWVGADNRLILENLQKLSEAGAHIRLRLPLIEGINTEEEDILPLIDRIKAGLQVEKIHLLPYHDIGKDKYRRMDLPYDNEQFHVPTAEKLEQLSSLFRKAGINNIVIGG